MAKNILANSIFLGGSTTLKQLGVIATADELNCVDGVTSNIQTQLDEKATTSYVDSSIQSAIENVVVVSATEPENISALWIDISNSNLLKFYNGTSWQPIAGAWAE